MKRREKGRLLRNGMESLFHSSLTKSGLFILALILLGSLPQVSNAQSSKGEYRQSQSRMLEPLQQVFVRPLVVDLKVIKDERQTFNCPYPEADVTKMTVTDIANLKVNALYLMAQEHEADVIVAPTFDIRTVKKGIEITVKGYPARYENWKVASEEKDYQWIEDVYGMKIRVQDQTQSIGDNSVKSYNESSK